MRILFVDDYSEIVELFCLCFTLQGHHTETAYNGAEALSIIERTHQELDVMILDDHMPLLNGLELLRQLSRREDLSPIPTILFTGYGGKEIERQALALGATHVVHKPTSPLELISLAQTLVAV